MQVNFLLQALQPSQWISTGLNIGQKHNDYYCIEVTIHHKNRLDNMPPDFMLL